MASEPLHVSYFRYTAFLGSADEKWYNVTQCPFLEAGPTQSVANVVKPTQYVRGLMPGDWADWAGWAALRSPFAYLAQFYYRTVQVHTTCSMLTVTHETYGL